MQKIKEEVAAHVERQRLVRSDCLLALYGTRIDSRRKTEHAQRLAEKTGWPQTEIHFALEVLAEQRYVISEGVYWRITAAGCLAIEQLTQE